MSKFKDVRRSKAVKMSGKIVNMCPYTDLPCDGFLFEDKDKSDKALCFIMGSDAKDTAYYVCCRVAFKGGMSIREKLERQGLNPK